jgi:TPR repeat protein
MHYAYALPILLKLVESNEVRAVNRVASLMNGAMRDGYFASRNDLPIKAEKLLSLLKTNYNAGDWTSGLILGDMSLHGLMVPPDLADAQRYYREVSNGSSDIALILDADEALAKISLAELAGEQSKLVDLDSLKALSMRGSLWAKKEYGSRLLDKASGDAGTAESGIALLLESIEVPSLSASGRLLKYAVTNKRPDVQKRLSDKLEGLYADHPSRAVTLELAQVYGAMGRSDEAVALLKQKIFEDDPVALFTMARLLLEARKIPQYEALADMRRAIARTAPTDMQLIKYAKYILSEMQTDDVIDADALEIISRFADRRNADAIRLGLRYAMQDIDAHPGRMARAIEWVTTEAKAGRPELLLGLASKQLSKTTSRENNLKLVEAVTANLDQMKDRGSARYILARAHKEGLGVAVDELKADSYLRQAAELGHPSALYDLATVSLYGIDEERDLHKAETLLAAASLFHSNKARIAEGRLHGSAFGSTFSAFQSFAQNQEAAETGSLAGMIETGRAYLAGSGVEKDEAAGLAWLEKAANKGSRFAASQLYFYHMSQDQSVQNEKARMWLDKAIALGHSPSLIRKAARLQTEDAQANAAEIQALLDQSIAKGHNLARRYKAKIAKEKVKP